ncbi:LamB/YcsF [Annulohypoxylon maeteangense]|uniref:LamB/YcsF n=1 Tax=Annulohypoxylon maeteangense TaxID=1927788 RepID=UPI002007ED3B|nr:LamB/YcsF [Annulohypoxylon maeteangense]KAI0887023.1 LamB/YcsF [Annulohypoxylon maeteangense]
MAESRWIEINCDMGEGIGRWKMGPDEDLMRYVDVANIACGFHAGDPSTMVRTVRLAKQHGVRVGAHPGMPDLLGFGRRRMAVAPDDMYALVLYQVGALAGILAAEGVPLNHVKPHGELYFYVQRDADIRDAVLRAVKAFNVPIYSLPTKHMVEDCKRIGIKLIPEFYADLNYNNEGQLMSVAESVPATPELVAKRILAFAGKGQVESKSGDMVEIAVDRQGFSICIHSDLPGALDNAAAAREAVKAELRG